MMITRCKSKTTSQQLQSTSKLVPHYIQDVMKGLMIS